MAEEEEKANEENTEQASNAEETAEIKIDQDKLNQYIEEIKLEQNLQMGILGGLAAMVICGVLWAVITVITEYQIGYMAVAVGLAVGYAVRIAGKGFDPIFGIIGALLSLIGCLLGNILSIVGFTANAEGLGYFETLGLIDFSIIPELLVSTFNPMDLLFYGIAIYEGYKFSYRTLTDEEILQFKVSE